MKQPTLLPSMVPGTFHVPSQGGTGIPQPCGTKTNEGLKREREPWRARPDGVVARLAAFLPSSYDFRCLTTKRLAKAIRSTQRQLWRIEDGLAEVLHKAGRDMTRPQRSSRTDDSAEAEPIEGSARRQPLARIDPERQAAHPGEFADQAFKINAQRTLHAPEAIKDGIDLRIALRALSRDEAMIDRMSANLLTDRRNHLPR